MGWDEREKGLVTEKELATERELRFFFRESASKHPLGERVGQEAKCKCCGRGDTGTSAGRRMST